MARRDDEEMAAVAVSWTEETEPTPELLTPVTSNIANVVECTYMVYGTFRERFYGLDARARYGGTVLYVPCQSGQIVKVSIDTLSEEDTKKYHKGDLF